MRYQMESLSQRLNVSRLDGFATLPKSRVVHAMASIKKSCLAKLRFGASSPKTGLDVPARLTRAITRGVMCA